MRKSPKHTHTHSHTPTWMRARTALSSPWQSPGSKFKYAVAVLADSPALSTACTSALLVPWAYRNPSPTTLPLWTMTHPEFGCGALNPADDPASSAARKRCRVSYSGTEELVLGSCGEEQALTERERACTFMVKVHFA